METCRAINKVTHQVVKIVWVDAAEKPDASTLFRVERCKSGKVTLQRMLSLEASADEEPTQFFTSQILRIEPAGPQYPRIRSIVG